jgi:peptidoglycan hydrolase CwlO-like protein
MSKKKTIADVREDIAATEKKIEQTENLIAEQIRAHSKLTRNARTSRLIQRGAI